MRRLREGGPHLWLYLLWLYLLWLYSLWLHLRVRRLREGGPHACDGGDGVCPGAQVGDGAKELKRGLLLLDRVARSVAVQGEAHTCELQAGVCRLRSADWGLQTGVKGSSPARHTTRRRARAS